MLIASFIIAAYLAGSVNIAIHVFRWTGKGDPRERFSGNAGATNVYRQAGLFWASVVLAFDLGRAVLIAASAQHWLPASAGSWIGLALIIGNRFPCFHHFRGGKGVASYLGFTLFMAPLYAALAALVWVVVYASVRIPFIASFGMIAVLAIGGVMGSQGQILPAAGSIATVLFIVWNHRKNMIS